MELRERIARALCARVSAENVNTPSGADGAPRWKMWLPEADAAIATMREWLAEVTPEMVVAWEDEIDPSATTATQMATADWRAMLAAKFGGSNGAASFPTHPFVGARVAKG